MKPGAPTKDPSELITLSSSTQEWADVTGRRDASATRAQAIEVRIDGDMVEGYRKGAAWYRDLLKVKAV